MGTVHLGVHGSQETHPHLVVHGHQLPQRPDLLCQRRAVRCEHAAVSLRSCVLPGNLVAGVSYHRREEKEEKDKPIGLHATQLFCRIGVNLRSK